MAIRIIGGGLAGTEAALMLADAGVSVVLHEQKPDRRSPAHKEDGLAELVCSNSLRSDNPENAIGLLHEELRRLGISDADLARISAPVGLDIGARTPEETAISIAAEIIALRENRSGARLSDGTLPVHNDRTAVAP